MRPLLIMLCITCVLPFFAGKVRAADDVRIAAPKALVQSGLLDYVLPRFSLKTSVRVAVVSEQAQADLALTNQAAGTPVFQGPNATWSLMVLTESDDATRLAEWLTGKIGRRTITSFEVDGATPFSLPKAAKANVVEMSFDGDAVLGRKLSDKLCGRFHTFYALNPHPSFTQVADVTPPFPIDRPSPIIPVEMTLDDLEAILAYVSGLAPADLGAPLQHQ